MDLLGKKVLVVHWGKEEAGTIVGRYIDWRYIDGDNIVNIPYYIVAFPYNAFADPLVKKYHWIEFVNNIEEFVGNVYDSYYMEELLEIWNEE